MKKPRIGSLLWALELNKKSKLPEICLALWEIDELPFKCTLPKGHRGTHKAYGMRENPIKEWN